MTIFKSGATLKRAFNYGAPGGNSGALTETAFFESLGDSDFLESIEKANTVRLRSDAAAACVEWVHGGDSDIDDLDAILYGLAGGTEDTELNDSDAETYSALQQAASEFILNISTASEEDVYAALDDEEAANNVFSALEDALYDLDADEAIADFSVKSAMLLEATKRVIRNGEIVTIKTGRRKRRMTAAQKAALKKARSKSNTAGARAARKKAARLRKSAGL